MTDTEILEFLEKRFVFANVIPPYHIELNLLIPDTEPFEEAIDDACSISTIVEILNETND